MAVSAAGAAVDLLLIDVAGGGDGHFPLLQTLGGEPCLPPLSVMAGPHKMSKKDKDAAKDPEALAADKQKKKDMAVKRKSDAALGIKRPRGRPPKGGYPPSIQFNLTASPVAM